MGLPEISRITWQVCIHWVNNLSFAPLSPSLLSWSMDPRSGPSFNIKNVARYGNSYWRRFWDHLTFIMGIPIMVRPHLYFDMPLGGRDSRDRHIFIHVQGIWGSLLYKDRHSTFCDSHYKDKTAVVIVAFMRIPAMAVFPNGFYATSAKLYW